MSVATIWRTKEIHILRQHYPNMAILTVKLNKSAYKIYKKAEELGLRTPAVSSKSASGGDHRSKSFKESTCLYAPKHRSIEDIEVEIAEVEERISKGIDSGAAWNNAIQRYNELLYSYDRALMRSKQIKSKP